jgi:hypothetical protein
MKKVKRKRERLRTIDLRIVQEGSALTVCHNQEPIRTPAGKILQSENEAILKCIIQDLQEFPTLDVQGGALNVPRATSAYYLFCTVLDFIDEGKGLSAHDIQHLLEHDPVFYPGAGPEWVDQLSAWEGARAFIKNTTGQDLRPRTSYGPAEWTSLAQTLSRVFDALPSPQRAAVDSLRTLFEGTVVFALALAMGNMGLDEYTSAVLATSPAHAGIFGFASGTKSPDKVHQEAFRDIRQIAQTVREFLACADPIHQLIQAGESRKREFKSTLRRNLRTGQHDDAVTHAVLKTIAAFLNSDGGVLLIGVTDSGERLGIEADGFENDDKFLLHLHQRISSALGVAAETFVDHQIVRSADKRICKVECNPSRDPVFLSMKGNHEEEFYIRTGPATTRLGPREILKYSQEHFQSDN